MLTPPSQNAGAAAHPAVADAVLGVGLAAALLVTAFTGAVPSASSAVAAVAVAVAVAAAITLRRRHPVPVLIVLDLAVLAWFGAGLPGLLVAASTLIGCYTLAAHRGWRWGLAGAAVTALVLVVGVRVVLGDLETAGVVPLAVLLAATAGSAGAAVGYYRAMLALARAQLAREARTREEVGRRLVAEERLRIARELHDVVGHAMATISVQAGVALHVAEQRPGQATEALAAIKAVCDDGLTDVKTALGILRADTHSGHDGRARPAPRPDRHRRGHRPARRAQCHRRIAPPPRAGRPRRVPHRPGGAHQRPAPLHRTCGPAAALARARRAAHHRARRRASARHAPTRHPRPRHRRDARARPRAVGAAHRGPAPRRRFRGARRAAPPGPGMSTARR